MGSGLDEHVRHLRARRGLAVEGVRRVVARRRPPAAKRAEAASPTTCLCRLQPGLHASPSRSRCPLTSIYKQGRRRGALARLRRAVRPLRRGDRQPHRPGVQPARLPRDRPRRSCPRRARAPAARRRDGASPELAAEYAAAREREGLGDGDPARDGPARGDGAGRSWRWPTRRSTGRPRLGRRGARRTARAGDVREASGREHSGPGRARRCCGTAARPPAQPTRSWPRTSIALAPREAEAMNMRAHLSDPEVSDAIAVVESPEARPHGARRRHHARTIS